MKKKFLTTLLSLVMCASLVSMMPLASKNCEAWDGNGHVNIDCALFTNSVTVTGVKQPVVGQTVDEIVNLLRYRRMYHTPLIL